LLFICFLVTTHDHLHAGTHCNIASSLATETCVARNLLEDHAVGIVIGVRAAVGRAHDILNVSARKDPADILEASEASRVQGLEAGVVGEQRRADAPVDEVVRGREDQVVAGVDLANGDVVAGRVGRQRVVVLPVTAAKRTEKDSEQGGEERMCAWRRKEQAAAAERG
jgi:hypothetical protein